MKKYDKKLMAIGISIIGIVVVLTIGLTYAFFTANIGGNENATQTVITTGVLKLTLTDTEVISLEEALPGSSATKVFTVKNTGNVAVKSNTQITGGTGIKDNPYIINV